MNEASHILTSAEPVSGTGADEEAALVRRAKQGDAAAQDALVDRWAVRVLALCRARVSDGPTAEDLAQEALLRAVQSLPSLQDDRRFGPWLRGIVLNLCRDWYRARPRRASSWSAVASRSLEESVVDDRPETADHCEQQEDRRQLDAAVAALPVEEREVLHLFYFEKQTYDDIAALLGIARSTVHSRLASARDKLKRELTP